MRVCGAEGTDSLVEVLNKPPVRRDDICMWDDANPLCTWIENMPSAATLPLSSAAKRKYSSEVTPPSCMKARSIASRSWAIWGACMRGAAV